MEEIKINNRDKEIMEAIEINNRDKEIMEEIKINGETYIKKASQASQASETRTDGLSYCIVRTASAGVFGGLFDRSNKSSEGTIYEARGIWYWDGACGLSQLARDGTSAPKNCKFTVGCDHDLRGIIDVLPCTQRAQESIQAVPEWKK